MVSVSQWGIEPAQTVGIQGGSGAGKTRLLRAIADLDPNEAQIALGGIERQDFAPTEWRRAVGLLPAAPLWWRDTPMEHFHQDPSPRLLRIGLRPERILRAPIELLSSGERQRLAFARILDREPRVLLLDEPTANLDPESRLLVEKEAIHYQGQTGCPILWVSHDSDQLRRMASRIFLLAQGRLQILPDSNHS